MRKTLLTVTRHKVMGDVRTHKDLDVWKEAMALAKDVYLVTAGFPKEEMYGLTSQARRSAVSVPSNIAEGAARNSRKEFGQFLHISLGSLSELESQLILAGDLGFMEYQRMEGGIECVRKMLLGLIKHLKNRGDS